jgi:uncharacterized Fe-S cluster protein YjdI
MSNEVYPGKSVTVTIHAGRCIHSLNCVLGLPAKGAWVHRDAAPAEAVAAITQSGPSDASTCRRQHGSPEEAAPAADMIGVRENGPLAVHADLLVQRREH